MLYPSIQSMTDKNVNRYMLVIAAAKGARYVTCRMNDQHDYSELRRSDFDRSAFPSEDEKAVSVAIGKLHSGKFKIVN